MVSSRRCPSEPEPAVALHAGHGEGQLRAARWNLRVPIWQLRAARWKLRLPNFHGGGGSCVLQGGTCGFQFFRGVAPCILCVGCCTCHAGSGSMCVGSCTACAGLCMQARAGVGFCTVGWAHCTIYGQGTLCTLHFVGSCTAAGLGSRVGLCTLHAVADAGSCTSCGLLSLTQARAPLVGSCTSMPPQYISIHLRTNADGSCQHACACNFPTAACMPACNFPMGLISGAWSVGKVGRSRRGQLWACMACSGWALAPQINLSLGRFIISGSCGFHGISCKKYLRSKFCSFFLIVQTSTYVSCATCILCHLHLADIEFGSSQKDTDNHRTTVGHS